MPVACFGFGGQFWRQFWAVLPQSTMETSFVGFYLYHADPAVRLLVLDVRGHHVQLLMVGIPCPSPLWTSLSSPPPPVTPSGGSSPRSNQSRRARPWDIGWLENTQNNQANARYHLKSSRSYENGHRPEMARCAQKEKGALRTQVNATKKIRGPGCQTSAKDGNDLNLPSNPRLLYPLQGGLQIRKEGVADSGTPELANGHLLPVIPRRLSIFCCRSVDWPSGSSAHSHGALGGCLQQAALSSKSARPNPQRLP